LRLSRILFGIDTAPRRPSVDASKLALLIAPMIATWLALSSYFIVTIGWRQLWYWQILYALRYQLAGGRSLVPFVDFLHENYRRVTTFRDHDEIWERKLTGVSPKSRRSSPTQQVINGTFQVLASV
jgi:hypothetical protein